MELSQLDLEEVAKDIERGCTSGIIDSEEENERGETVGYRISWDLKIDKFEN